jgi:hypothetical protein
MVILGSYLFTSEACTRPPQNIPPPAPISSPVTKPAWSETRNPTISAMSCGCPAWPSGVAVTTSALDDFRSGVDQRLRQDSAGHHVVDGDPSMTYFTRQHTD